ncbi:MAG: phage integrase SAM-like domain-containing protein [Saprospiraceae bacterium]|nr:phage integrase SAM-like domain-containing protein [Saprospiraceae bacterium]
MAKTRTAQTFFELFDGIIEANIHADRIGNSDSYRDCKKCIERYHKAHGKGQLTFNKITVSWLNNFDRWMSTEGRSNTSIGKLTKSRGLSETTRGIYLRELRAALNTPVNNKAIFDSEAYPFGDKKFVIPTGNSSNKKIALENEVLRMLLEVTGLTPAQERQGHFGFFFLF